MSLRPEIWAVVGEQVSVLAKDCILRSDLLCATSYRNMRSGPVLTASPTGQTEDSSIGQQIFQQSTQPFLVVKPPTCTGWNSQSKRRKLFDVSWVQNLRWPFQPVQKHVPYFYGMWIPYFLDTQWICSQTSLRTYLHSAWVNPPWFTKC